MNKKGQALVEFVIILPIFIFMVLATIDIGKILYFSNKLENKMDDVISMYENNNAYEDIDKNLESDIKKTNLEIKQEEKFVEFIITKKVDVITPGLNLIFDNPYEIEAKRVVYNE